MSTQKFSVLSKHTAWGYPLFVILSLLTVLLTVAVGSVTIPLQDTAAIILNEGFHIQTGVYESMHANIVMEIRLPRTLLAFLVGGALAIAGASFQGFLKNPLADPYTLGVSSGSALGAVTVLYLGLSLPLLGSFTLPVISIIAGFITLLLVLFFARLIQKSLSTQTIILTGIIFSSFLGSLISLLIALTGDELRQIVHWLMGSVAMRGWDHVLLMIPFFIVGSFILFANARELNTFVFGEETARTLGVNTERRKYWILGGASLLTGSAVAVAGTIGFVGLVIPHLVRLLVGPDHRHLLPLSILAGGSFLALTDMVARTIIAPTELPIGVITAMIGAPIFGVLLYKQRRKE
ncbi:FecCD family ABC transporter permease [Salsuginibacillus kocurii]|uniref:FecCD family ABC transporter permease n=1 Tax=Salsuginibacillus kocurii TaxID=427078 RepID=UPI00058CE361|nr:iron ABC transporter permease [Salsuginibacillus kocurii]